MEQTNETSIKEAKRALQEDENVKVIDVREDEEVATGMIENAIHIPLGEIPHQMNTLSKDNHYIIVCRSGGRSSTAATYLSEHGFSVSNMAGGMIEWDGEVII